MFSYVISSIVFVDFVAAAYHPKLMLERKVVDQGNVWAVNYNKLMHYERSKLEESTNKFFSEKIIQKGLTVTYYLEKQ